MCSWQSTLPLLLGLIVSALATSLRADDTGTRRPNILFAIADDWGWPHAGAYGDPVVQTPTFDRLARDGVLFEHAYVSSPSCTPSRGAILTGQYHWRLKGAANLWSVFPDEFRTYPHILEEAGYDTGVTGKGWGPGRTESPNRPLVGRRVKNFREFLASHPEDKPFCFWLGSSDPHRPYKAGTASAVAWIWTPSASRPASPTRRSFAATSPTTTSRSNASTASSAMPSKPWKRLANWTIR